MARITGRQSAFGDVPGLYGYLALSNWDQRPVLVTQTGSANYKGGLRGSYFRGAADPLNVSGDMTMTVNFSSDSFYGSASNFKGATEAGAPASLDTTLDFTFGGRVFTMANPAYFSSTTVGANGYTGYLFGEFAGPKGGEPTEAGVAFGLYDASGANRLVGVAGLGRTTTSSGVVRPPQTAISGVSASDCARTPNALACGPSGATTLALSGIEVVRTVGGGAPLPEPRATVRARGMTIDTRGTSNPNDDVYVFASRETRTFNALAPVNDGLGGLRRGVDTTNVAELELYDVANVLSGGLDYVQLGRITGGLGISPTEVNRVGTYYFTAMKDAESLPKMPTTGTAKFVGATRGTYVDLFGGQFRTQSQISLTADFGANTYRGEAGNWRITPEYGDLPATNVDWNMTFSGALTGQWVLGGGVATMTGTSYGDVSGTVNGYFAAATAQGPPVEIGMSYNLAPRSPGGRPTTAFYGVGGLKLAN